MSFKKIKIVTDSTCDIPADLIAKWGITVIPVFVNIGDQSYADDGIQLNREEFYDRLADMNPLPTTAAPSPGITAQHIEKAFEGADHLIVITIPTKLSATYNAMKLGAEKLPQDRVTLIDCGSTTMALGFQVLAAAEVAAETGDVDQVIAAVSRIRDCTHLAALINSLENLRRSGRVNFAQAGLGALLQIKPIITVVDGVVETLSRVRTTSRAREELVQMARQQMPIERMALLHTNNLEGIEWLREQLSDILPPETHIINITTAVGTHVGPRCLGFVSVKKGWRS